MPFENRQEFPDDEHIAAKMREEIERGGEFGDRRQQIVLIGISMDRERLEQMLDMCLLTDEEMALGEDVWAEYENPFLEAVLGDLLEELEEDGEEGEEEEEGEGEDDEEEAEEEEEEEEEVKVNSKYARRSAPIKKAAAASKKIKEREE